MARNDITLDPKIVVSKVNRWPNASTTAHIVTIFRIPDAHMLPPPQFQGTIHENVIETRYAPKFFQQRTPL